MDRKYFEALCKKPQMELKKYLAKQLQKQYPKVITGDGYVFAQGEVPILLVAHMDTVHDTAPSKFIYLDGKVSSPTGLGADDRAGIYMIMEIIKKHKCSVLFCEDEEIGCKGAEKFVKAHFVPDLQFNYIIELDRKGSEDAVFYDCGNKDFQEFITETGDWKLAHGSFTDICTLAPVLGCAAVNFSCGYYGAHTKMEYLVIAETDKAIEKVCRLIERTKETDRFEWVDAPKEHFSYYGNLFSSYNYGFNYDGSYGEEVEEEYDDFVDKLYGIEYVDEDSEEAWEEVYAISETEAIGKFLMTHPTIAFIDVKYVECFGVDPYMM